MSILLDAVSKSKQQSNDKLDPIMNPYHQFQQQQKHGQLPFRVALLSLTVTIGVAAAWWFTATETSTIQAAPTTQIVDKQVKHIPIEVTDDTTNTKPNSNIELAGKVALPLPKVYQPQIQVEATGEEISLGAQPNHKPQNANDVDQTTQPEFDDEYSQSQASIQANNSGTPSPSTDEQTEIVLGAPKTNIEAQNLEALKRQVELAASDVGLKTEAQRKQDDLVDKFQAALSQVELEHSLSNSNNSDSDKPTIKTNIPKYGELPAGVQLQVPEFNINAHMYSTDPKDRILSVDGVEIKEGDKIKGKLKVIEIRPRDVVLEVAGKKFKVPAI
ncbi:hypothetical protein D5R81_19165 [Parashewanella spongiae]|uniref:Type II secretion system protein GspB C-terminal domain-containing protein n=1 Tax=Parashewanella spongiae TaxID=342950 RepID=A0A3A6T2M1_9GAMM|nr:general secretion pathway protein GspB [Parashewanella spongiae]MCL1079892.1 general secretion pathway protein GspB [Parashewanella spongiae]RJY02499.1 hypothetical protein D5R81_19165 [Parashewanella spongiae]